jgi:alkylation response protein AidB-like acyl-CoA dehydrogenase
MDFNLDDTQQEIADLATRILTDRVDHQRLRLIEGGLEWFDRETYAELAKAGLVGIALSEEVGGGGLGLVELGQVLIAQGRTVAPLPLIPTLAAALTIDAYGSPEQITALLPGVVDGTIVLSTALQEYLNDNALAPTTLASQHDGHWAVTGTKVMVEFAEIAAQILVAAQTPDGVAVFLVDPHASGVSLVRGVTSRREPVHELHLDAVPAQIVGSVANGAEILRFVHQRALAMLCAVQIGVADQEVLLTAAFTSQREQFGRPIATFQAVTQRLADMYIEVQALRLTTYSALWRLSNGLDASEDLFIAKWFGSDGAHFVAHGAQHMHGGAGVDIENPLHRYTLWNKHIEGSLGAGTASLRSLGALLAAG